MYSSQVSGPAHSWLHRTHRTLSQPASALTRTEGFRPGRHPCVNRRPILTPAERGCWRLVQAAVGTFTLSGRLAKMSDQERWLNEILDILGLPRDTAYRDYTREL